MHRVTNEPENTTTHSVARSSGDDVPDVRVAVDVDVPEPAGEPDSEPGSGARALVDWIVVVDGAFYASWPDLRNAGEFELTVSW